MHDLEVYCKFALEHGASNAKQIHPNSIVTAEWVRLKCQFGCDFYGKTYCCPPDTPTPEQTRSIINYYNHAILFHVEIPGTIMEGTGAKKRVKFLNMLIGLEIDMFKDGYYKAFAFLQGFCHLCKECAKLSGNPCNFMFRARPSMEACGIDVFQTVRNNGFFVAPLRKGTDTKNIFGLILVD